MKTRMTILNAPWALHFDRDGTEDFGTICDAEGGKIVTSQECVTCWLPTTDSDEVPALAHQLRLMAAAPWLLEALDQLLSQTVDMDLKYGITLTEGEEEARQYALAAIAEATYEAKKGTKP